MNIYIEENYNALSKRAADIIVEFLRQKPDAVLGLPTDSTSKKIYEILSKKCEKEEISFKKVKAFNLDEYLELSHDNQNSFHNTMKRNLFSKIDVDIKNTLFPDDLKPNYEKYDDKIKEFGGIDLQILGIGRNGHIGFNEPGSEFSSKTREITLTEITVKDNSRFFESIKEVPKTAVTMGIDTIMQAKKIILLASGENKSEAIFNAFKKEVSEKVPASILQRHKNVIVILDKDSAKKLKIK